MSDVRHLAQSPDPERCWPGCAHGAGVDDETTERLAFALYTRCGDRSVQRARRDAAAVLRWLASGEPIPVWFYE